MAQFTVFLGRGATAAEPQRHYIINYVLVPTPLDPFALMPGPVDWGDAPGPPPLLQTWIWRQVHMLGQDRLPAGGQVYDRPQQPSRIDQTWTLNLLETTLAPVIVTQLPFYQLDWPLTRAPGRIDETWVWNQLPMLGMDQLPVGDQVYDLSPKAAQRLPYYGTEWRQVGMLGQDQLPIGDQIFNLPVRAPLRAADLYTWIQSVNLALNVTPAVLPLNQYDWPLPRTTQQPALSWAWRQVQMLGLDRLPTGKQLFDLPVRGLRLAVYDWIQSVNLALNVKPGIPKNQFDWPLPNRGPAQPDRSFVFRSQFIPPAPPPFIGAQYFLLQPHYIKDAFLDAWTTVTEGREIPIGWIPTLMVDPLNDQAVAAFYAAGPRTGYPGPGYDWQGYQGFTARRTAAIQSPITHWMEVSPGKFKLTGLGTGLPPVGA